MRKYMSCNFSSYFFALCHMCPPLSRWRLLLHGHSSRQECGHARVACRLFMLQLASSVDEDPRNLHLASFSRCRGPQCTSGPPAPTPWPLCPRWGTICACYHNPSARWRGELVQQNIPTAFRNHGDADLYRLLTSLVHSQVNVGWYSLGFKNAKYYNSQCCIPDSTLLSKSWLLRIPILLKLKTGRILVSPGMPLFKNMRITAYILLIIRNSILFIEFRNSTWTKNSR